MDSNLINKVNRLNELYHKVETGNELTNVELNERAILRDEIINYFRFHKYEKQHGIRGTDIKDKGPCTEGFCTYGIH